MLHATTIVELGVATAVAGLLRGYSGFGGGLVMAPFFTRIVGPTESVVLISLIHLATAFQGVRGSVRIVDAGLLKPLVISAVLAVPIGVWLLAVLDPPVIKSVIAVVVLIAAVAMALGLRLPGGHTPPKSVAVGILSGILNGFCGIGGPPAVLYVLAGRDASAELRASFIVFFAVLYPTTVATLAVAGVVTWASVLSALILSPVYFAATELGRRFFHSAQSRYFIPICTIILCVSAVSMLLT